MQEVHIVVCEYNDEDFGRWLIHSIEDVYTVKQDALDRAATLKDSLSKGETSKYRYVVRTKYLYGSEKPLVGSHGVGKSKSCRIQNES